MIHLGRDHQTHKATSLRSDNERCRFSCLRGTSVDFLRSVDSSSPRIAGGSPDNATESTGFCIEIGGQRAQRLVRKGGRDDKVGL